MPRLINLCVWFVAILSAIAAIWSWGSGGLMLELLEHSGDATAQTQQLKDFFLSFGPLAPLSYLCFVTAEVVIAPIPGLMLYAPGGMLFGPLNGGLLSLAGNICGAGIACSITRSLGQNWCSAFFPAEQLEKLQHELEHRGIWLIFLLRINPLTSSDIISYAAGFTRLPIWKVMLSTACGMAPLCFAQAWLADNLLTAYPDLLYLLLAACAVYVVLLLFIVKRLMVSRRAMNSSSHGPN